MWWIVLVFRPSFYIYHCFLWSEPKFYKGLKMWVGLASLLWHVMFSLCIHKGDSCVSFWIEGLSASPIGACSSRGPLARLLKTLCFKTMHNSLLLQLGSDYWSSNIWFFFFSNYFITLQIVLTRIRYGPARYWAILFVFWFLVFGIWASRTHGAHTT